MNSNIKASVLRITLGIVAIWYRKQESVAEISDA